MAKFDIRIVGDTNEKNVYWHVEFTHQAYEESDADDRHVISVAKETSRALHALLQGVTPKAE